VINGIMSCSFNTDESLCGAVHLAPDNKAIVPVKSLNEDVSTYLKSLKLTTKNTGVFREWELICNRGGIFSCDDEESQKLTVCPKHRNELGRSWQGARSLTCKHPNHIGKRRSAANPRRVNQVMSEEIYHHHNAVVPIGSGKFITIIMT
tara:strand:+ start:902 stop:1348 length:447 start_codon:yes stop_codon:yes gene_type:complete